MYTAKEKSKEFWMLTKGILQDSRVDTDEAAVVLKWLEEHGEGDGFARTIGKLRGFLKDGYIDRYESKSLIDAIGSVLAALRSAQDAQDR